MCGWLTVHGQGVEFRVYGVTNDVAVQTSQGVEYGVQSVTNDVSVAHGSRCRVCCSGCDEWCFFGTRFRV